MITRAKRAKVRQQISGGDNGLKHFNRELDFVLKTVNPFCKTFRFEDQNLTGLDEGRLIEVLSKNKLFTKFSVEIDTRPEFKQELFERFRELGRLIRELNMFWSRNLSEFVRVSKKLAQQDIHLLLIKSAGDFPHESSNFDCLIKPSQLCATARTLAEEGYCECLESREPHKFLFRKHQTPRELPLHIHTRVEWEAIEFADPKNLRDRARVFLSDETGALVPSVEDAILVTVAHYFFEDHEMKIYDLLKLHTLVNQEENLDWEYMFSQAEKLGWTDALALNKYLVNRMSLCCFGQKVFADVTEEDIAALPSWVCKIVTFEPSGLQKIPYGVSALFFLRKVLRNPQLTLPEKYLQINYVFSDILRRKSIGYIKV
ncbi:MAG: nucleotidyltransferase family protein [Candidatus Bathyarchaeota archaeon]|nr:nucleotidyltransferase family protein [Candidatus Bathyarchaeota archaeon]